jgi:hypothetical protein
MPVLLSILGCMTAGVVGATLSLRSSSGGSALWAFFGGQVALVVWAWMTKQPITPWFAAILFDGVYNITWLATLVVLGEQPSWKQVAASVLVIGGLLLAGVDG